MKSYFRDLFQYNHWANNKVMDTLSQTSDIPDRSQLLMSHIIVAEIVWLSRIIQGKHDLYDLWTSISLDKLRSLQIDYDQRWLDLVINEQQFDREIAYRNTKGNAFSSKLSDILIHLANHGTYHRGQIAMNLRENGLEPTPTDFIFYKRQ